MSGCLATSIFDKKPSRLHNTLVNIYGDDEAGLKRAATEYFYFESDSFKEDVGFDWQTLETIDRKGIRSKITSEEAIILGYVNEQLEPNVTLFGKKKLPKVQRTDGSDKFIEGKPFEGYDESDIREFVDNTIFHGLGKMKGLERIDFEGDVSATVSKELEVGGTMFKIAKEILELTDFDIKELKKRIIDNLRMKQLALQDNDDLEAEVNNYPNEDDPNAPEQKSSNAVVKVDAFTVNSKNTASANVKIMLSFIPEMASYTEENGVLEFTTKKGKYMPVKFKDMDKIWRKLEDNISNIFTKVTGNQIESVLDQMMTEIYKLGKEDPTIMYVYNKLKSDTLADYKKIQFAQAFTKQKIVFFTSEVSGNNLGDLQYKFFDAGKSTSKENTLRSIWETGLLSSDYYSQDEKTSVYKLDSKAVAKDIKLVDATLVELRKLSKEKIEVLSQDRKDRLNKVLENLGIPVTGLDPNTMTKVLKKVQAEAESKTFSEVRAYAMLFNNYVNPALKILSGIDSTKINSKSGNLVNSIKSNPLTVMFAEVNSSMRDDISESTTMGANNKMMWGYSLPTYIDITMHRFKTGWIENDQGVFVNPYIESLRSQAINKNSKWLEFLSVRENTDSFYAQTFNSFQKTSDNGMDSVDNKDIRFFDQLSDQVNKMLNGTKDAERSIYYSPTNADKGRLISFVGPDMVSTAYTVGKSGNIAVSESSKSVEQVLGYFEDEYSRMTKTWNTVTSVDGLTPALPLYVHMHIDKKGKIVNEQGVPIGNGFKSQLFPELSPTYQTSAAKTSLELDAEILRAQLYDSNNRMKPIGITDATEALLKTFIAKAMTQRIRETQVSLEKQGVFKKESDVIVNKSVDKRVWDKYSKEAINRDKSLNSIETSYKITGDYVINGIISNVEYSKVFAGDVAYFKDTVDYNKRIPATYTDGKYLVGIDDIADKNFKIAVINTIEIPAKELEDLKRDFIKSLKDQKEFMPDHIKKIYDDDYIDELAQTYTDAFKNVNAADAQAWISLKRWKFLKTKLDGWSPKQEESYQRMIKGKFTHEDLKMAAQPLKGVYFNRDQVTGVPTYLKYSQMVMIPGMFKGTSLEQLTIAMQEKDIDEVITLDGVKVGAVSPTTIHTQEGGFVNSKDMQFNVQELSNLHWKLQQQLPVKGMKDNMDLGSQMQKNVISNIKMDAIYGKIDGGEITGKEIVELIHETISELADIGFNSAINSLGTNPDGTIKDKGKFYNQLAKSLEDKNMPSFIVDMISRGYDLDAIPQVRYKAQNVISATINNAVSKTTTPGGSMIQMSNVGVTIEDLQAVKDNKQNGIYLLKDNVTDLKRPKIDYDNNTVSSGQIFIPHSFIAKHIPDYRELSREDLMKKVDYKLLQLIGYRIPNQKMSSIQPLEIVGILPESMGDAVMMYSEITTQTGSDFDIDKTYIMMPEYRWDEKADKLRYIESKGILKTIKEKKDNKNTVTLNPEQNQNIDDLKSIAPAYANYSNEQIQAFIESKIPDSKVKEVVFHGTPHGKFDKFDFRNIFTGDKATIGHYFLNNIEKVKRYLKGQFKEGSDPQIISSIVNVKNIRTQSNKADISKEDVINIYNKYKEFIVDKNDLLEIIKYSKESSLSMVYKELFKVTKNNPNFIKAFTKNENVDAFFQGDFLFIKDNAQLVVLDTDDITILNSPKTIREFKEFVKDNKKETTEIKNFNTGDIVIDDNYNVWEILSLEEWKAETRVPELTSGSKVRYLRNEHPNTYKRELKDNPDSTSYITPNSVNTLGENKQVSLYNQETNNDTTVDEESVVYNQGKKQLRNQLFELYNMVLKSTLTFADGMSSIDGAALKNGINETHNNEGVKLKSLDLMNPYYQLGVKFDNSVGKAGVGLTANQMVDHVFTQIHDSVLIDTNIGIGNIRGGSQDFSEIYDTDGKVITDTISMFLNGYVDIAKDPYITKGNFNTVTSNLVFFMIRGGVPLDYIIKFIGQPAFFEVTETKLASESLVLGERPLSLKEASNIVIAKYQEKLVDLKQDVTDTLDYKDLSKVSKEKLQSLISSKDESDPNYLQAQIELLKQLATIDEISRPLSELILASKSDVNGGGPDIASHMTGLGRYNKVLDDSAFTGISERFAPNSMLGSKTLKTLQYLNRLDEELFLSASPNLKPIYTILSINKKGSEYILDKQFVQDIEKEVYGYAIGDILKNIPELEISKDNVEQMFKSPKDRTISDRVAVLKIEPNLQSNALIQNLEFKQVKAYKYVTLDNFKAKPNSSLDEIQRGWQQLLDTPKYRQFGLDLVKYAFTTSGFSRNRNSIYDVLPMEISDILNRNILQFKEETNQSEIVPEKFLNNFLRSPNGENWVSTIYPKSFGKVKSYTGVKGLSGFNPDVKTKLKELGLTGNPAMLFNIDSELDFTDDKNRSEMLMYNKLKNDSIIVVQANVDGEKVSTYFKNEGIVHIGLNSYHFLTRTHKLGLNEPGLKIYEYGIDSEKSFISTNNPLNYDKIEEFSNWMKDQSVHEEFSMNTDINEDIHNNKNENIHNNKNAIRSSEAALDNLTRRGIIEKKC